MTLKFYKCACATPHLHKISNLAKKIVSTGQFTFDYKVLKRYMIRKIVKQGIIWFSIMQIRYFKDLRESCLNKPEYPTNGGSSCYQKMVCCNKSKLVILKFLRSIKARFSLIVAHFRPEIFYWLVQKIRSLSSQKPAIIQFHDQR